MVLDVESWSWTWSDGLPRPSGRAGKGLLKPYRLNQALQDLIPGPEGPKEAGLDLPGGPY